LAIGRKSIGDKSRQMLRGTYGKVVLVAHHPLGSVKKKIVSAEILHKSGRGIVTQVIERRGRKRSCLKLT